MWGAAGHALHPDTCMECWLLPCTISAQIEEQTPLADEQRQLQVMHAAAKTIQRWWRVKLLVRFILSYARSHGCRFGAFGAPATSTMLCWRLSPMNFQNKSVGRGVTVAGPLAVGDRSVCADIWVTESAHCLTASRSAFRAFRCGGAFYGCLCRLDALDAGARRLCSWPQLCRSWFCRCAAVSWPAPLPPQI
jgi:hypothetical protein